MDLRQLSVQFGVLIQDSYHIVILIHLDVDAICTTRILQSCINYESIQYSLAPVEGINDMKLIYEENKNVKCFVFINCGGTIDLVEELNPPDDVVFFILDSHRPTDLCNIYSSGQVRLLWTADDEQNVPEFDDVFKEDEEEDEDDDDEEGHQSESDNEGESRAAKRRRLGEEELLKRIERRKWEENRRKIIFEYEQYSYYGKASAMTIFDLSCQLSKDNRELLWYAILAITEQLLLNKIEFSQYRVMANTLALDVERLSRKLSHNDVASTMKIKVEKDLKLNLYRHWSVTSTLMYSLHTTVNLRLWTRRGERRLLELLADMSLPLVQSKQKFFSMDLIYRQEFSEKLQKFSEKYNLGELLFTTFTLQFSYRSIYSASDIVYVIIAMLEMAPPSKGREALFNDALDCLTRSKPELIESGLEKVKCLFENCFKLMKMALDQKKIFSTGPFLYFIIHESYPDWHMFCRPHALQILAQYIQHGYCERYKNRNSKVLPLIVSCPNNLEEGTCLLVGLPPLCEDSPKNLLGKAFEQAAERSDSMVSYDFFDTSYVQLRNADRTRFLDSLTALLS